MAEDKQVRQEPARSERPASVPVRPGRGMTTLRDEVSHLFDRFMGGRWPLGGGRELDQWPSGRDLFAGLEWPTTWDGQRGLGCADLSETDTAYELQIDMPGIPRDSIQVELSGGLLTVSGERSDAREDKRKGYYLSERSFGSVQRSFRVPDGVVAEDITAQMKDGVLTLTLPKSEEMKQHSRRIEVK